MVNKRVRILSVFMAGLFALLAGGMYSLMVLGGEEYTAAAESAKIRTVSTRGYRGRILDRYGRALATSEIAYEVVLNLSEIDEDNLNRSILGALAAMRTYGAECSYSLPIENTAEGLVFKCTGSSAAFITAHGLDTTQSTAEILGGLRGIYSIPDAMADVDAARVIALYAAAEQHEPAYSGLDKEAYAALVEASRGIGQPFEFDSEKRSAWPIANVARLSPNALLAISDSCRKATGIVPAENSLPLRVTDAGIIWHTAEIRKLKQDAKLDAGATAEQCIYKLAELYGAEGVPGEYLMELLAVRLEAARSGYRAYNPLTIGIGRQGDLAAVINENSLELQGVSVQQGYLRHYPYGELLSSTLGYTGRITAENEQEYRDKGYDISSDLVGRDGLEQTFEEYLRPSSGSRTVTIDRTGKMVDLLDEQPSQNGNDVVTTIDLDLQLVAEASLKDTMEKIRNGDMGEAYPDALVGAAVALDVNNGDVLAMASQPGYDINLFSTSISDEAWKQLNPAYTLENGQPDNDPTLPRPLVNNAVAGAYPPGSAYKPVTAAAALMERAVTTGEQIEDKGRYTRFSETQAPACWTWNESHATHGMVDMHSALSGSCNYYFYEMGYRLGNKRLEQYARRLGLGEKTGIELPNEATGMVGGEAAVQNVLKSRAADMAISFAPDQDKEAIEAAVGAVVDDFTMNGLRSRLARFGLSSAQMQQMYDYINDNRWRESRVVSAAVGQGDNNFSVLQMAVMASGLAKGGLRYKPTLLRSVPAQNVYNSPVQVSDAFMDATTIAAIKGGMNAVVSERGGTAYRHFAGCRIQVAGKTGSAQFEGRDAYAWFISFAPVDDPQIAVAVMIGRGGKGSYSAPVARAIIEEYFKEGSGEAAVEEGLLR